MRRLADGLWHWTARHPEWHGTSEFSASVGCYLAHADGRTILIDPLLTEDIDDLVIGEVVVAVTIPYHVRDSAQAIDRYGGVVSGHPDVMKRLPAGLPFDQDAGLHWHPLKRGKERPLLRVRKLVDPTWISMAKKSEYATGLDSCGLAVDVHEQVNGKR